MGAVVDAVAEQQGRAGDCCGDALDRGGGGPWGQDRDSCEGRAGVLGTSEVLKSNYASGYQLVLEAVDESTDVLTSIVRKVTTSLPAASLASADGPILTFDLPSDVSPADMALLFDAVEAGQGGRLVADCSVHHAST